MWCFLFILGPTITSIYRSRSSPKNVWKSSATSIYQPDIKDIYTERKVQNYVSNLCVVIIHLSSNF